MDVITAPLQGVAIVTAPLRFGILSWRPDVGARQHAAAHRSSPGDQRRLVEAPIPAAAGRNMTLVGDMTAVVGMTVVAARWWERVIPS